MVRFDEQKVVKRYRISKELVRQLAVDCEQYGYCSTTFNGARGYGLSYEERVSK